MIYKMSAVKVIAFTISICLLAQLLKQYQPTIAVMVSLAGVCALCVWCLRQASEAFEWLHALNTSLSEAELSIVIRCIGVAILIQLAQEVCKDTGQAALAAAVEFTGRIMILLCALPLIQQTLATILELLQ